tara:strand:+ start:1789 stop:1998 length:210 start_codon:yes stop_codon:yes gene_type:complete
MMTNLFISGSAGLRMDKKGVEKMWWIIGGAILVIFAIIIGLIIMKGGFDKFMQLIGLAEPAADAALPIG